ncbi:MAG TPA: IS200/IS605 family transposase [Thermomicrobiales bacterium]|nr:IS200/IS605 family transposase [Thermomicrobiales bacterium]
MQRERQPPAIFVHLVWATWDRLPLLNEELSRQVYHAIGAKCQELGAQVIAIGGIEDHVHLLARLPATLSVADLLKHVKGASSHLVTHHLAPGQSFKWQGSYGVCSVSPRHLAQVGDYIARQREHHAAGSLIASLEHEPPSQPA